MEKTNDAPLRGVVAATLTPLDADLVPDAARLEGHCRWLLANGCDGINLLGTTGEATSLAIAARLALMEAVAESGLPLSRFMVGTGASALADTVTLTARAAGLGFAGALVIPPFYFKNLGEDGVFAYFATLIERVADPALALYLYHFPALSGVPFTLSLIERLIAAYPGTIVGLKDSSGDLAYSDSVVRAFPELDVFPSSEAVLLDARRSGYAGCISATANITAPLAGRAWTAGASEASAGDAQSAASELRATIARYPLVAAIRHVASDLFGDARWERILPPLEPLTKAQAVELDAALRARPAYGEIVAAARFAAVD
jgi:4-hydroxy-tetrahydrodipicolinate synthase